MPLHEVSFHLICVEFDEDGDQPHHHHQEEQYPQEWQEVLAGKKLLVHCDGIHEAGCWLVVVTGQQ